MCIFLQIMMLLELDKKQLATAVVVYFDQLMGAVCTQKMVETFFSVFWLITSEKDNFGVPPQGVDQL